LSTPFTIQNWTDALISSNTETHHSGPICPTCSSNPQIATTFLQPLPYLHFEIPPEMTNSVLPSHMLTISNVNMPADHYFLRGIIYYGQLHSTAHLIMMENVVWTYDGQLNMGIPIRKDSSTNDVEWLMTLQSGKAYVYVYQHMSHPV
jgi:hypothetical protein